jgi:hypothetical protein
MKMTVTLSPNLKHVLDSKIAGDDYSQKFKRYIPVFLEDLSTRGKTYVEKYPPPPEPKGNGSRWVRGLGLVYYKKDGSMSVYVPSEKMNTKWQIDKISNIKYSLKNSASYSGFVQVHESQIDVHQGTGWLTDRLMIAYLKTNIKKIIPNLMQKIRSM